MIYRVLDVSDKNAPVLGEVLDNDCLPFARYAVLNVFPYCSYMMKVHYEANRSLRLPLSYYRAH